MTAPAKARRVADIMTAHDPAQGDLDRAAAVSRIARRKGTLPAPLAEIRRQCIARAREAHTLAEIGRQIQLTVPRVIQLLAQHRSRTGAGHDPA